MSQERHTRRLLLDLAPGQSIRLQGVGDAHIKLVHKTGRVARIKVVAPETVRIIKNNSDHAIATPAPSMAECGTTGD